MENIIDYKELYLNRIRKDVQELIEFLTSNKVEEEMLRQAFLDEIRKTGVSDKLKELL
jgi:uncharacterized protein YnzC (UPF0291/DUF896 family)